MSARTKESPLLAHQRPVAVADGAEKHLLSIAVGDTPIILKCMRG
jgi:hypothetical protein